MSANTKIGWTDDSANLWWGCFEPAPDTGCKNCYARELAKRYGWDVWGVHAPRRMLPSAFESLRKFQKRAIEEGRRRRVFVNSMSDLSEIPPDDHPQKAEMDAARQEFFYRAQGGEYANLDLIWLTKLIGNVSKLVPPSWTQGDWPENLWLVPTITNQKEADRDLEKLRRIPAKVRGLSLEPLLGPIDLMPHLAWLSWLIVGAESGPKRREMPMDAARLLIVQGIAANVPVFVKQDGALHDGKQGRFTDEEWAIKQYPHLMAVTA